jgi:hypothetical protein
MLKYTEGPVRPDYKGGYLLAHCVGGSRLLDSDFLLAEIRGMGHLQYLPDGAEIQDGNLRRLAAAWNAVQGIPTEDIQPMAEENKHFKTTLREICAPLNKGGFPIEQVVSEAVQELLGERKRHAELAEENKRLKDELALLKTLTENDEKMSLEMGNDAFRMRVALEEIITYNRNAAEDQHGDPERAEHWACVKTARKALKGE